MTATAPRSAQGNGVGPRLRANVPILVLVAWTWFVWVGRVRNIVADDTLSGGSMIWRLALALTFVVAGAAALVAVVAIPAAIGAASRVLAWFGIVVWLVRGTDIALGDHSAAFIAVHTVLAIVTIVLGVWVLQKAGRGPSAVSSVGDG